MNESRKKKLAMLTRSIARGDFAAASDLLRAQGRGQQDIGYKRYEPENPVRLEEACVGAETHVRMPMGLSRYWLIRRALDEVSPEGAEISRQYAAVVRGARQSFDELKAGEALCHVANAQPEDLLFMDVESCGFSGAIIFLVGMMQYRDGQFHFEQYLARNYAEEPAILKAFCDRFAESKILVTYNGKAFDLTMIRDRSVFHGFELPRHNRPHLDLLMEARRLWKGRLPNCKLQTLEKYLCGRNRVGDIPGCAIADAYHKFVDTADARQVRDIVHHNLLDLLTMGQLVSMFLTNYEPADLPDMGGHKREE